MAPKLCGVLARMRSKTKHMVKTCGFITRIKMVTGSVALFAVKKSNLLVAIFSIIGCNKQIPIEKSLQMDPVLAPYVQNFIDDGAVTGHNIVVDNLHLRFGSGLGSNILGTCWMYGRGEYGTPLVIISSEYWAGLSNIRRKTLLYHELGHCVLFLEHRDGWITTSDNYYIPRSIMYPYLMDGSIYSKYWNYYIRELFNGSWPNP